MPETLRQMYSRHWLNSFASPAQRVKVGICHLARNQFGREFSGAFGEEASSTLEFLSFNESPRLLEVCILASDHAHEPVLDVWIEPVTRADLFETNLDAGDGAPHAQGFLRPTGIVTGATFASGYSWFSLQKAAPKRRRTGVQPCWVWRVNRSPCLWTTLQQS